MLKKILLWMCGLFLAGEATKVAYSKYKIYRYKNKCWIDWKGDLHLGSNIAKEAVK